MAGITGKVVQMVVPLENFRDEEVSIPANVFSSAGATVLVASNEIKPMRGTQGGTMTPYMTIDSINVSRIDALVIAGGAGTPQYLWGNDALIRKVRAAHVSGKIIAAIDMSGVVLAQAGVLKGRRATVLPTVSSLNEYKRHGVSYVDQNIIVAGRIVTARGYEQSKVFAETVIRLMRAYK